MINNNTKIKFKVSIFYATVLLVIFYLINLSFWWSDFANKDNLILKYSNTNVLNIESYQSLVDHLASEHKLTDDLTKLTSTLESHPYVKAARVSRHYPNQIIIEIVERNPIAIVNKDPLVLLDEDGFVLPNLPSLKSYDLPIMSNFNSDSTLYPLGEKVLSIKVQQCISLLYDIQVIYNNLYNNLSEMNVTSNNEFELILTDQPTHIYLGNKNIISRINVLKEFEKELKPQKISDFSYLDMRYQNQIVARLRKS